MRGCPITGLRQFLTSANPFLFPVSSQAHQVPKRVQIFRLLYVLRKLLSIFTDKTKTCAKPQSLEHLKEPLHSRIDYRNGLGSFSSGSWIIAKLKNLRIGSLGCKLIHHPSIVRVLRRTLERDGSIEARSKSWTMSLSSVQRSLSPEHHLSW